MTATRYKTFDSQAPRWLTLYDVETPDVVASDAYAALGALGSERERKIMYSLRGLSRRTYKLLGTALNPEMAAEDLPGKYILVVSFEIAPENEGDFNKWCAQCCRFTASADHTTGRYDEASIPNVDRRAAITRS